MASTLTVRRERGRVRNVQEIQEGSVLVADAAAGASVLFVESVQDFDAEGGELAIEDELLPYVAIDDTANTITLEGVTADPHDTDAEVYVDPGAINRYAHIAIDDAGDEGEVLVARVEHGLWELLTTGTRLDSEGEWVIVEHNDYEWIVTDVLGRAPAREGAGASDGDRPDFSPGPPAIDGFDRSLRVEWIRVPNADPVIYEVHISTDPDFGDVGSEADATTLFLETEATGCLITHAGATGSPRLENNESYYVGIFAKDADGGGWADPTPAMGPTSEGIPVSRTDGVVPVVPGAPTLQGGIGLLVVRWTALANNDPLFFEVHISTNPSFVPTPGDTATLAGEMFGEFFVIRKLPNGTDLVFGTNYYARLIAFDEDGAQTTPSPVSNAATISQAGINDIAAGAITAAKLEATLIFTSKIVAGVDATNARVEMGYFGGASYGLRTWRNSTNKSFELNGSTGDVTFFNGATLVITSTQGTLDVNGTIPGLPSNGIVLDPSGIRMYAGGVLKAFLSSSGGSATFEGAISASTITGGTITGGTITGGTVNGTEIISSPTGDNIRLAANGERIEFRSGSTVKGFLRHNNTENRFVLASQDGTALHLRSADDTRIIKINNSRMVVTINGSDIIRIGDTNSPEALEMLLGNLFTRGIRANSHNNFDIGQSGTRYATIYCVTLNQSSDLSYKKSVVASERGLPFILGLKPKTWTWDFPVQEIVHKNEDDPDTTELVTSPLNGKRVDGFLAKDVAALGGSAVQDPATGEWSMSYTDLIAPIVASIQALYAELTDLRGRVRL